MSKFIVIEGVGGAGKTTQIEKIAQAYPDALFLREPGATTAGEAIREMLFAQLEHLDPVAQLYLLHAARWQNVLENILPALESGRMVVCDRFVLSTFAYQVYPSGREDVLEHLLEAQAQFLSVGVNPEYIFLDVSPEISMKRIASGREDDTDSFDERALEFHQQTYDGYKQGIRELGLTTTVIDASQEVEEVSREVLEAIGQILEAQD